MADAPSTEIRPDLRVQLERIAEALGLAVGVTELTLRLRDGSLRWWSPARVRVPASELSPPASPGGA